MGIRFAWKAVPGYAGTNEDAIIANRPQVLEHVAVTLPGGTELGKEARDLLAPVAWPRLREPANRVVVAVGFPESVDPLQRLFQRQGFQALLPVEAEGRASGAKLEGDIYHCCWLRYGRFIRVKDHLTEKGALHALGLSGETLEAAGLSE